ncbi:hypothetical protein [Conexibacter sp. DBS9H8]|uniref:hypothetical protein n=1 Tax=Conexibacter sp. DBS9H8 TaxID=2937801 RepID=UPI00200E974F|nr:hypothetical protein [Conexibacter sp. DBS9H8]
MGSGHLSGHLPPPVVLGDLGEGGLAPAIAAIVERGVQRRPDRANRLSLELEIRVLGPHPPTRVCFRAGEVLVEDGAAENPAVVLEGTLADLVAVIASPVTLAGLPSPATPRGRAALTKLATRRVRVEGPLWLRRELLALLRI